MGVQIAKIIEKNKNWLKNFEFRSKNPKVNYLVKIEIKINVVILQKKIYFWEDGKLLTLQAPDKVLGCEDILRLFDSPIQYLGNRRS